jgi:hypothetical protein
MKLSRSRLLIPAASLLLGTAIGSAACSSSGGVTRPHSNPTPVPPEVAFGPGYVIGGHCMDGLYVVATTGNGFLACDDGTWDFYLSDSDFAADGYSEDTNAEGPDGPSESSTASDSTSKADSSSS